MSDKKKDTKKDQKRNEYYAFLKAFGDANPSMPLKVLMLIKIFELNEYPYAI